MQIAIRLCAGLAVVAFGLYAVVAAVSTGPMSLADCGAGYCFTAADMFILLFAAVGGSIRRDDGAARPDRRPAGAPGGAGRGAGAPDRRHLRGGGRVSGHRGVPGAALLRSGRVLRALRPAALVLRGGEHGVHRHARTGAATRAPLPAGDAPLGCVRLAASPARRSHPGGRVARGLGPRGRALRGGGRGPRLAIDRLGYRV
jgi:hypothetical protein